MLYCKNIIAWKGEEPMTIRIGYIGSAYSVATNKQLASEISSITYIPYTYEYPYDVPRLYEAAQQECDVICFSGIVPHFYRDHTLDSDIPTVITPFHPYMVVTSLLTCIVKKNVTLNQISIDLPTIEMIHEIEQTIGYSFQGEMVVDYQWIYHEEEERPFPFNEIVQFHQEHYMSGKAHIAITSIHYVYDKLQAKNIPVMYMTDSDNHLQQVLEEAKQKVRYAHMHESMIATLYMTRKGSITPIMDEHIRGTLQNLIPLHDQTKDVDIAQYYTTKGMITKSILQQLDQWMEQMEGITHTPFSFGIGYGSQLFDAQQNASDALQAAIQEKGSNGYIVTENNKRIGPLIGGTHTEKLRVTEKWLDEVITKSQTNMKTMRRFIQFMHMHNFQPFTAHELASYSDVTVRTAERFIKKIVEAHIIESYGQEQHVQHGRPRTIYGLKNTTETQFRSYIQENTVTTNIVTAPL